jgi:NADPH-dependent 2,4-dienoyl-CoA reductase/sulfur reductase-like enzyme
LISGERVESIEARDDSVAVTAGGESLTADLAVVAVGVTPAVELAQKTGVELGATGAIRVDKRFATSVPHIWAVGDCVELEQVVSGESLYLPLGSLANRQGRTLANILAGREDVFPPVAGSVAVKVPIATWPHAA